MESKNNIQKSIAENCTDKKVHFCASIKHKIESNDTAARIKIRPMYHLWYHIRIIKITEIEW